MGPEKEEKKKTRCVFCVMHIADWVWWLLLNYFGPAKKIFGLRGGPLDGSWPI